MAKRSDFAQKLLDDLRQRKERLASSSQSSNRSSDSSMAVIDAYSYAKKNYRGSKDTRTNDMAKASVSDRSSFIGDSAQNIVPYNNGGARSSHQIGDLSMALSFALQNGAKTRQTDSSSTSFALEFLHQIGLKPIQPSQMESRGNQSRRFQAVQIDEIAKVANRLSQILLACSNGVNLDQFSTQIGKDLLKGAVDLENSLKLLVDLQEPQRKNRIKLLEEDEEEERGTNVAEEWKLDRPRFSFDRTEKHGSHRRSASSGANSVCSSSLGEFKAKPSSLPQKARIPSVIAKLMGLEKLPEPEKEIGNVSGHKEVEVNPFVVNNPFVVVRERNMPSNYGFNLVFHGEKPTTRSEKTAPKKERAREMNTKNNSPASKERQTQPPARKPKGKEANSKIASTKSNKEKLNKKSPRKGTNSVQSELSPNTKHQDEEFRERISAEANTLRASKISKTESSAPSLRRIKVPKGHNEHKSPQRIDETVIRRSVRHQSSAPKEAKNPRRLEKLCNREDAKIKPNESEAKNQREVIKEAKKRFGLFTLKEDFRTRMEEPAQQLSNQNAKLDDQINQVPHCEDQELEDIEIDEAMDIDVNNETNEETEPAEEPITLTDSENRLKDILVKSPLFLNTAVALFDLEIPINVLQPSSHENDDASDEKEQRRLALDCGYELMRRKGRRQELSLYPSHAKASLGFVKIRAFEGLVRDLSRGFEKLRVYGGCGGAEEYLIAMQESDVHGREPDVNCGWDLGWSESFFAFAQVDEIARDVEKFVLNALLDEITRQLLCHCQ